MPGGAELSEKLPDELYQLVESFKKFVREQKAYRDQKFDVNAILEIGQDAEEFTLAFQRVAVDNDKNSQLIQQIKDDTTKLLRHSELAYSLLRPHFTNNPSMHINLHTDPQQQQQQQAQQTSQLPSSLTGQSSTLNQGSNLNINSDPFKQTTNQTLLHQQQPFYLSSNTAYGNNIHNQFSNNSSSQYFAELADQFESRMKAYGEQIKELKMSLDSITKSYNVDELSKWLKKQHETLGEIAAKIYMTHERIMEKKSEMDKVANIALVFFRYDRESPDLLCKF